MEKCIKDPKVDTTVLEQLADQVIVGLLSSQKMIGNDIQVA